MVTLKIIFVALLCLPLVYISSILLGKLYDEYVKKHK